MNEAEYIEARLDDQMNWHDAKSSRCQQSFKRLRMIEIVAAALIPFLSGMSGTIPYSQWLIGGLGALIAIAAAITALFRYQENWIEYRATAEQLKHEKFTYLTGAAPYNTADKFPLLVARVEAVLRKQNEAWVSATPRSEAEQGAS